MPAKGWRGGTKIKDHRKYTEWEGRREGVRGGRRDGLTRISAPWLLGLGVILTLYSQHTVNSHSHTLYTLEDWPRTEFRESSAAHTFLSACLRVTLSTSSRCGLPFLIQHNAIISLLDMLHPHPLMTAVFHGLKQLHTFLSENKEERRKKDF